MADVTVPDTDRRPERRAAKMATILEAAWSLARQNGLGAISLRELADRVGLRQPSLYAYFDSKNGLYDAMFEQCNHQLLDRMAALELPDNAVAALKAVAHEMAEFCVEDPTRHQLLFRRTIPGFEPSPDAYEP